MDDPGGGLETARVSSMSSVLSTGPLGFPGFSLSFLSSPWALWLSLGSPWLSLAPWSPWLLPELPELSLAPWSPPILLASLAPPWALRLQQ